MALREPASIYLLTMTTQAYENPNVTFTAAVGNCVLVMLDNVQTAVLTVSDGQLRLFGR